MTRTISLHWPLLLKGRDGRPSTIGTATDEGERPHNALPGCDAPLPQKKAWDMAQAFWLGYIYAQQQSLIYWQRHSAALPDVEAN